MITQLNIIRLRLNIFNIDNWISETNYAMTVVVKILMIIDEIKFSTMEIHGKMVD